MAVHQREGTIGEVGALGCVIPCVYGHSGVFSVVLERCNGGKDIRSVFLWGIMMDKVCDEALNSVFKALLWGGLWLPLFYA